MAEGAPAKASGTVDAVEHARVLNDLAELSEQFAATNEVLSALGRSAGDPDAVLTTVVESARRLCRSQAAKLYILEDGVYRLIKAVGLSEESIRLIAEHPMPLDRDTLDRPGRAGPRGAADRRRAGGSGVRTARPPASRGLPDHDGRADARRRRGRRCAERVAQRGAPVRRAGDGHRVRVRRPGGDRGQQRPARAAAGGPRSRARAQGRGARGAPRGRRGGQLQPRRRRGPGDDRDARRRAVRDRRRLDHGVLGADQRFLVRSVYRTDPSVVERLRTSGSTSTRRSSAGPPGNGAPSRWRTSAPAELDPHLRILYDDGLAVAAGRPDAAGGADRRAAWSSAARRPARSPRRPSSCWRPSRASRRWRCSTPGCSASSRSRAPSWSSPAGTSPSSWRACRTSCGRR